MSAPIQLFIVDDNCLLREGLVAMLAEQEGFVVLGAAAIGHKAIQDIIQVQPHVALIDFGISGEDGIKVTRELRKNTPEIKVVIFGMSDLTTEIMAWIEAGAAGYVLKESSFEHLSATIRAVHSGEAFCTPRMTASLFSRLTELTSEQMAAIPKGTIKLTNRELQIVKLLAKGLTNKEIADRLFIAIPTVKKHVHNILKKLQLGSRIEAVQYARKKKLLHEK